MFERLFFIRRCVTYYGLEQTSGLQLGISKRLLTNPCSIDSFGHPGPWP